MDGIRLERQVVYAVRERADLVIDTSNLTAAELERLLTGRFARETRGLRVFITSLAYRHGLPRNADLIFDVRFLDNPHCLAGLRPLTGRDAAGAARIERDPGSHPFFWGLLRPLLPRSEKEGRAYLTIGAGCTRGRHRWMYVAGRLAAGLRAAGSRVELSHRDLARSGFPAPLPSAQMRAS